MKILLLATEIPDAQTVRDLVADAGDDAEVYVVAPALEDSPLRFWVSDVDDAIATARKAQQGTVDKLQGAGVTARGDVGEAEPGQAAEDALAVFAADRVLILTHEDNERAYREEELDELRGRLKLPVEVRRVERSH